MNWQKLRQLLIVFIAGIFLFVTTACGGAPSANEAPESEQAQDVPAELSPDSESETTTEEEAPAPEEEMTAEEPTEDAATISELIYG